MPVNNTQASNTLEQLGSIEPSTIKPQVKEKNPKKTIIILGIILVLLAGAFYIYYKYYAKGTLKITSQNKINLNINGTDYPQINQLKLSLRPNTYVIYAYYDENSIRTSYNIDIKRLRTAKLDINLSKIDKFSQLNLDNPLDAHLTIMPDGSILFYNASKINKIDQDGTVSDYLKLDFIKDTDIVQNITWSSDFKKIIFELITEDDKTKNLFYDIDTQKTSELDSNNQSILWNTSADKIIYNYLNGEINNISISDPDGTNWKKVKDLSYEINKIYWLKNGKIAYFVPSENTVSLSFIDDNGTDLSKIAISGNSTVPNNILFSPSEEKIAYSINNDSTNNITLNIISDLANPGNKISINNIGSDEFVWAGESNIIYLKKSPKSADNDVIEYHFINYSLTTKTEKEIAVFDMNSDSIPTNLLFNGSSILFLLDNDLYRFKYVQ